MSGSAAVSANMKAWLARKTLQVTEAMDSHIKASEAFAKGNHPWQNRTGAAEFLISSKTESSGAKITSHLGGFHIHNVYLENWNKDVYAYGNKLYPFGERFQILEMAARENWEAVTLPKIQAIMSRF